MRWVALQLCAALAATTVAQASEQSEALSARGLVELQKGHTKEAMALFDRAIATDPQDALARYQRGVAYAKEDEFEEAIADLQQALALRPDLDEAALELGVALIELNRNAEARPWLVRAQKRPDLEGQASFFLGIADMRDGRLDEARIDFERARAKDPTVEVSSRYYLGVVDFRAGNGAAARSHFAFVQEHSPDSAVGREAAEFLELIRAGEGRPLQLYGSLSLQYDTNVVLQPAQSLQQAISNAADGRVAINAGGIYVPWRSDSSRLSLGYDFYQSLQFQLTDFNLTDNRPTVQFNTNFGSFRAGVLSQYDYYLLDGGNFLQEVTALPFLVVPEEGFGRTELYVRFEWLDYLDPNFDLLSGYNYAGGVRQVLALGNGGAEAWLGYHVESNDTTISKLYAYDANQFETAVNWPLPWSTDVQAGFRFRQEEYNQASAVFVPVGQARLDREYRLGVAFRKDLTAMVTLVAAWIGTFNVSNKIDFEYNRQVGSIGVEARY